MFKTNFYTGEMSGMSNQTEQFTTEAEATQNAGFGQYAAQMQGYVPPTTYGLGGNYYQQQYVPPQTAYYQNPYMNQPNGYISQPYGFNRNYGGMYGYGGYQQINQQPQQPELSQVFIPPVNLYGNEYLLPSDFEDRAQDMLIRYYQEEAEYEGKKIAADAMARRENNFNPYAYNGLNYYGNSFYGAPYQVFHSKVFDELNEMKTNAKNARLNLSMKLSKLAHKTIGDDVSDEQIKEMYTGKYIDVENTIYACSKQEAFQRMVSSDRCVPVDPGATPYREYYYNTWKKIQSILPQDTPIEEFGPRINLLLSEWELEELKERRRGFGQSYDSSAYKRLLKEKCAEKAANQHGFSLIRSTEPLPITQIKNKIKEEEIKLARDMTPEEKTKAMKEGLNLIGLPLLSDAVYFDNNGQMCLKANIGNHKGEMYTVFNENEAKYANKRAAFAGFLDSIPKSEELHDQKIEQYNGYSESEFMYNMTHPKPSNGGG